ncbi:uncharacterized protein cubi_02943 [Cryptosporidium ubiquitum]|uniref:Uncharacterized protein n=1 Tax=Cryptosporidium ubiquitum TaxID=857276 RepID=A0A1J4MMP6_9CRYT|nr:uncharacterized protein cubi_02943 [Cryptosporidium ubiquitum]OII74141.1 hypothetical protein cubi_02943 [Cryptosporidium ubiquitum]
MSSYLSGEKYEFLSTLGLIGVVIGGVWYMTKNNKKFLGRKLNNEEIKNVLVSVSNELHPTLMEFSHLVSSINNPTDSLSIEFLNYAETIFSKGGFKDKIVKAQKEILNTLAIDPENFENLLYSACKVDREILMLKLGIDKMYQDSLLGVYPLLPYLGSNENFSREYPKYTKDYILNGLRKLNNEKEKGFKTIIEEIGDISEHVTKHPISGITPSEELSRRLKEANRRSEDTIFGSVENKRLFSHAIALYSREVEFVKKKKKLEKEHSDNILNIIINCK